MLWRASAEDSQLEITGSFLWGLYGEQIAPDEGAIIA
jgi:hypothetical protein